MYVSKGFVNLINDQTDRILPNKYVISYYRFKINNKYVVCNINIIPIFSDQLNGSMEIFFKVKNGTANSLQPNC